VPTPFTRSSPGVPYTISQLVPSILSTNGIAASATPIWAGPVLDYGVVNTTVSAPVLTTGGANVWPKVLTNQGVAVPYSSSTPIVLPNQEQPQ
jgi:hypothetical protein